MFFFVPYVVTGSYNVNVGMVGSKYSVLGTNKEIAIRRYLTGIPERFEPEENDIALNGIAVTIDKKTKLSKNIQKIRINL